jgi:hypothetical protein
MSWVKAFLTGVSSILIVAAFHFFGLKATLNDGCTSYTPYHQGLYVEFMVEGETKIGKIQKRDENDCDFYYIETRDSVYCIKFENIIEE